jgi:hypothetical protein
MNITGDLAGTAVIPATNIADGDTIERAVTISNTGTGAWSRVRFKTSDSSTLSANEVIDPNFSYVNSGGSWALGGGHMSVSGANMVYSGTGVPANGQDEAMSQPMTFPVGTQLVVSYNYNDSQATSGSVQACLYSAATGCHGDLEAAGTNGSASFYWTVGATDGPLQFALYPYLINVPVGKTVTFSGPSIQVIGTPTVDSATNGFQLQIDRCSIPWNNGGTLGNPYNCTGTQTAVLAATPVIVTTPVSLPGLSSLAPGSTDYLRVRIFLPSASNVNNLEDQAPVYNLTFQAVQRIASTTNS